MKIRNCRMLLHNPHPARRTTDCPHLLGNGHDLRIHGVQQLTGRGDALCYSQFELRNCRICSTGQVTLLKSHIAENRLMKIASESCNGLQELHNL